MQRGKLWGLAFAAALWFGSTLYLQNKWSYEFRHGVVEDARAFRETGKNAPADRELDYVSSLAARADVYVNQVGFTCLSTSFALSVAVALLAASMRGKPPSERAP